MLGLQTTPPALSIGCYLTILAWCVPSPGLATETGYAGKTMDLRVGAGNPILRLSRCGLVLVDKAAEQVSAPNLVEIDVGL